MFALHQQRPEGLQHPGVHDAAPLFLATERQTQQRERKDLFNVNVLVSRATVGATAPERLLHKRVHEGEKSVGHRCFCCQAAPFHPVQEVPLGPAAAPHFDQGGQEQAADLQRTDAMNEGLRYLRLGETKAFKRND